MGHWKKEGRHDLPWRKTNDPYAILVSEIMLQQTQVDRVIPYFARWMKSFPTPRKLAQASLEDVLRHWSGLGYNRRAKFLHEAGKWIVEEGMPNEYRELRALPGVGEYTAKAVRVFAYNQPEVLIETNVRSVFIHHFFPSARSVSDARLLPLIEEALDRQHPRQWYSALMDYGTHLKTLHPNPSRKSRHHAKQSPFKGSLREIRGEILKAHLSGAPLATLKTRYGERFIIAYDALRREKMLVQKS